MEETFIGDDIKPLDGSFSDHGAGTGKPALPTGFQWRKQKIEITEVLSEWKDSGACRNGSSERYLRKHWFQVRTSEDVEMKIYFERQPRGRSKKRWRLYSTIKPEPDLNRLR